MASALQKIFELVIWVFVPLILLLILQRMFVLGSTHAADEKSGAAARAGFWAGLLLFAMFLIYQVNIFIQVGFPVRSIYQGFDIWLALSGALIAFVASTGGKRLISPRLMGVAVLLGTFLSSSALIHYLFIRTYNEALLSLILGVTFGVFAHFTASPSPGERGSRAVGH